ncbi:MAG: FAD-dependent oxidoreductase [Opitutaceae bacterium]
MLTQNHGRKIDPLPVEDPVGLVWWPHDLHEARRLVRNGAVWQEGTVFDASVDCDWAPFGLPYRSLVPRASECVNLLTPTCPSMSYVAYGAFRLEYQFMIAAQSAVTAAALALDEGVPVQSVSYERLRARLLRDGQILTPPSAVTMQ